MQYMLLTINELVRALIAFIFAAFGLEFLKEGLVSNALDLHKALFATAVLFIVQLLMTRRTITHHPR